MSNGGGWFRAGADQSALDRYGVALVSIAIAFVGRLLLEPWLGDHMAYATLMVAVTCSAWYGGMGPGVFAMVVGMLAAAWLQPEWHVLQWTLAGPELAKIALFVAMSLIVAMMGHRARSLRLRDRERRQTLEQQVAERTREAEQRLAQLRLLHAELTQVEQRERRHLAHVLHDGLQQLLVVAKLRIGMLLRGNGGAGIAARDDDRSQWERELRQIEELLGQSIDASRSLTVELFPPILADRGLVAALHWLGRHMREKYRLHVEVSAPDDAEAGDEQTAVLMFHAARELLFNVVKHAGVDVASLSLWREGDRLCMEVHDAGRGMDLPERGECGAPEGGFGLFALQQRLEMAGGTMRLTSRTGHGMRIRLQVHDAPPPVACGVEPHPLPATETPRKLETEGDQRLRVLVVDDHQIVREGVRMLLCDHEDITVIAEASDGQMAVEMAEALEPDVVLMDISMPRLDGIEATARIMRARPDTRVIGLSMHQEQDVAHAMHSAGAAVCLPKASAAEVLVAAIRRVANDTPKHRDHLGHLGQEEAAA